MPDPTIITLTTIPSRFGLLGPTLRSLLAQDLPAAQIILYIPRAYRRFPDWDGEPPRNLPEGVTVRRLAQDYGPATKLLPALREFSGQAVDLLVCDDDRIYPPGWHRGFKVMRPQHPRAAIAAQAIHLPTLGRGPRRPERMPRMRRWVPQDWEVHVANLRHPPKGPPPVYRYSGHADQFEGWAGVMLRPEFFTEAVFDIPPVLWAVDDTWISGHLESNDVPIWLSADIPRPRHRPDAGNQDGLLQSVIDGHSRVQAERACMNYYREKTGIWAPIDPLTQNPPPSPLRRLMRRILPYRLRAWVMDRRRAGSP